MVTHPHGRFERIDNDDCVWQHWLVEGSVIRLFGPAYKARNMMFEFSDSIISRYYINVHSEIIPSVFRHEANDVGIGKKYRWIQVVHNPLI